MITDGKLQLASNSLYGGVTVDAGSNGVTTGTSVTPGLLGSPFFNVTTTQVGDALPIAKARDLGVGEPLVVGIRLKTLPSGGVPVLFSFSVMLSNATVNENCSINKVIGQSQLCARTSRASDTWHELFGWKVVAGDWVFMTLSPFGPAHQAESAGLLYLRVTQTQFWNWNVNDVSVPSDASGTCEIYLGPAREFLTTQPSKTYPSGAIN